MGRHSHIKIKESIEELEYLVSTVKGKKEYLRLQSLLHIKKGTFRTRQELADYLGFHIRTMERWLSKYDSEGISSMLTLNQGAGRKNTIPSQVHEGLAERLQNPNLGFRSYMEALEWVEKNYNHSVSYITLWRYMRTTFGTKIKSPRKSHVKKNPQAKADFLKLT